MKIIELILDLLGKGLIEDESPNITGGETFNM